MSYTKEELINSITEAETAQMEKIERLINLNKSLAVDRESLEEIASEIIEQRREDIVLAGLDVYTLEAGLSTLIAAYNDLEQAAIKARFAALREGAKEAA